MFFNWFKKWFDLGNKSDMNSLREVEQIEAMAMAELIPEIILVLESSAKDNTNVEQSFVELAIELKVKMNKFYCFNNNLHFLSFSNVSIFLSTYASINEPELALQIPSQPKFFI